MAIYAKKNKINYAVVGAILIFAVIFILGYFIYHTIKISDPLDKETLCPTSGSKGHYVVLIDNTSPFPYTQKAALSQRLKSLSRSELPEGYMLSVFLLGENATQNDEPLFERCNPGQWGDKSELTSNKKFVDRDFREKFSKPLDEVIKKISLQEHAKKSPIFEMIQLVGINGFERIDTKGERKLIIYSDMLANTQDFSMYNASLPSYLEFSKTPYAQRAIAPTLHDVSIVLNIIAGDQKNIKTQSNKLVSFWENYFEASGASIESVNYVEGL